MKVSQKPKFEAVCNGCGMCCALEVCQVGEIAFPGAQAPCPALKIHPELNRTYCELVLIEKNHNLKPMLQEVLGIGLGCSMRDNDES